MSEKSAIIEASRESAAFNIGWDAGMYGLEFYDEWPVDLRPGWAAARRKFPKPKASDRFVRKWIQLRAGAYFRGKHFSDRVTPGYLRAIDSPLCPVSLVKLTHGEGADTDWSVDRVDNDRGYVQQNLVVLSTRVNSAKADLGYDDLRELAIGIRKSPLLQPAEWTRLWLAVMQFTRTDHEELDELENYYVGQPPVPDAPLNWIMSLQIMISVGMSSEKGNHALGEIDFVARQSGMHREFKKFAKRCCKYCTRHGTDSSLELWRSESIQRQFMQLMLGLRPQAISRLKSFSGDFPDYYHRAIEKKHVESWAREGS